MAIYFVAHSSFTFKWTLYKKNKMTRLFRINKNIHSRHNTHVTLKSTVLLQDTTIEFNIVVFLFFILAFPLQSDFTGVKLEQILTQVVLEMSQNTFQKQHFKDYLHKITMINISRINLK